MLPSFYFLLCFSLLCSNSAIQCMQHFPLQHCARSWNSNVESSSSDISVQLSDAVIDDILSDTRSAHAFLEAMADRTAPAESDVYTNRDRTLTPLPEFTYYCCESSESDDRSDPYATLSLSSDDDGNITLSSQKEIAGHPHPSSSQQELDDANFLYKLWKSDRVLNSDDEQPEGPDAIALELFAFRNRARQVATIGLMPSGQSELPTLAQSSPSASSTIHEYKPHMPSIEPRKESIPSYHPPKTQPKVAYKHQPQQPTKSQQWRNQRTQAIRSVKTCLKDRS